MKNLLRYFLLLLTAGMIITSCQKELSAETGTSKGALVKDAGGNCSPATPNGTFKKDTALTNNNYVDVQVNITEIGVYFITTDTVNGYSFKASGVTVLTGANTIRLIGVGKPLAVGTDNFKVKFDGSVCDFAINVLDANGGGGGGGSYTIDCASAAPLGLFYSTLPTFGVINLTVNATAPTTYNISTDTQNGVSFTGTGGLTTGSNIITLVATAPNNVGLAPGNFTYSIVGSSCTFGVNFQSQPAGLLGILTCNVNGTFTTFNQAAFGLIIPAGGGVTDLKIIGFNNLVSSSEQMSIDLSDFQTVTAAGGTFNVNSATPDLIGTYNNPVGNPFIGEFISGTTQTNPFKITIITNTATRITGTFSGELEEDGAGTGIKIITNGIFDVPKG